MFYIEYNTNNEYNVIQCYTMYRNSYGSNTEDFKDFSLGKVAKIRPNRLSRLNLNSAKLYH